MRCTAPNRSTEEQTTLWPWVGDKPLTKTAQKRHYLGHFFEELAESVFQAERLQEYSTSRVCPDLRLSTGDFAEVKGSSGEAIVFTHRISKDLSLTETTGKHVWYVYLRHAVRFDTLTTLHALPGAALPHIKGICVIRADALWNARESAVHAQLKYRSFDGERNEAWRFSFRKIEEIAGPIVAAIQLRLRGTDGPIVPLRGPGLLGMLREQPVHQTKVCDTQGA